MIKRPSWSCSSFAKPFVTERGFILHIHQAIFLHGIDIDGIERTAKLHMHAPWTGVQQEPLQACCSRLCKYLENIATPEYPFLAMELL